MNRASFFDPLYDYITFEEADVDERKAFFNPGWRLGSRSATQKQLIPFLSTIEFNRLSFLRQSNLAFLVYPSSTHTRFAHAIGCCYLGYVAAHEITVICRLKKEGVSRAKEHCMSLSKWLDSKGWKEEFLLSLLLHDIGHFAFSHALESNANLWKAFGSPVRHEDVACEFLSGSGPVVEAFREKNAEFNSCRNVSSILADNPNIQPDVVSYLIRGKENDLLGIPNDRRIEAKMLHELTSGLLDLDRIDHYRRDSYFSGLKFASNLNFTPLLQGLSIRYDKEHYQLRLSNEAVGHALTLLHAKERLIHDLFQNPLNMGLEVMLHHALNLSVFGNPHCERNGELIRASDDEKRKVIEMLICTDEELLLRLEANGSESRDIVRRIKSRDPYAFVGRKTWDGEEVTEKRLRTEIAEKAGVDQRSLALILSNGFNANESMRPVEWLKLSSLYNERGKKLANHPEYALQIKHFKNVQEESSKVFWVFTSATDTAVQQKIEQALDEVAGR